MALARIDVPIYEVVVPSTDEKIKDRPFLVEEEKLLLIALESGKNEDILRGVKDIVDSCTFNKLKLGNMPMFDIEYIFLQIRSKAVGEVSTLRVLCQDDKFTVRGIPVVIDKKSQVYVEGAEIDHRKKGLNEGFEFYNPKEKARCGCGESFTV